MIRSRFLTKCAGVDEGGECFGVGRWGEVVLFGEAVEGDVAAGEGAEEGVAGEGFVVFVGVGEGE